MDYLGREKLGLSRDDLRWMTDEELALAIKAWQYSDGRRAYLEQYAQRYREWEQTQRGA